VLKAWSLKFLGCYKNPLYLLSAQARGFFSVETCQLWYIFMRSLIGFRLVAVRQFATSSSLANSLRSAGCTPEEVDGWSKEMTGWSDHSVQAFSFFLLLLFLSFSNSSCQAFLEKLKQMNGSRLPPAKVTSTAGESGAPYVNPVTGEIGGPIGPEPTRYNDWSYKGRCTDF
jgi:hypothetical protein